MSLLQPATNNQAFLKMSLYGFAKSGKSFTAMLAALGLHKYIASKKPVAFFDTETGSNYLSDTFKEQGVNLLVAKTRSFVDLLAVTKEAEKTCDIMIADSITHPYVELVKGYKKKMNRERLRVQDWGPIKEEWAAFTELYLNSKLHIIMCGRAGWEYEFKEDEDGVTDIQKTGTKMKTETDFGYEPGLAVEMERVKDGSGKIGQTITQRAWIIGDRFNRINGKCFEFPTEKKTEVAVQRVWDAFFPHIEKLKIGADYGGIDTDTKSGELFKSPDSRSNWIKRKEIALDILKIELDKRWSSRSDAGAKMRVEVLEKVFGTASPTAIADLQPEVLEKGLIQIKELEILKNA